MPTPLVTITPGCASDGGFVRIAATSATAPGGDYTYTLTDALGTALSSGGFNAAELPLTLPGLTNGGHVLNVAPASNSSLYESFPFSIACGATGTGGSGSGGSGGGSSPGTPHVGIVNVRPTAATTASGTGSLHFDVSGLAGRAYDVYVYRTQQPGQTSALVYQQLGATNPVDCLVTGLAVNTYNLLVYAVQPPGTATSDVDTRQFRIPAFVPDPRGGCTDRQGTNYDAAATFDNGSCTYLPLPVPVPVFAVPLLNPLRFVQVETPDNCGTFETADNTLFCQQARPGQQRRPLYYQPVATCDPVRVQVLTNYPAVEAVIHRLADGQVLDTQQLSKVLALQGEAPYLRVALSSAGDGFTQLIGVAASPLPPSLFAAGRVALRLGMGGPLLHYRVLRSGRASATVNDDYLVLNRPWVALPAGSAPAVSWLLSGPGFNVWEGNVNLAALPEAAYEIRLHGYDQANRSATAVAEPIALAAVHENTVVVEYGNIDNAYGTVFSTGYTARMRIRGTFFRQKNAGTVTEHRNSDGSPVVLASTAQRLIPLETYDLPAWLHEKLFVATRLDYLRVNGLRGKGVGNYEYGQVRQFPLSTGRLDVEQVEWLGTGNSDDAGTNDSGNDRLVLRTGGFLKLRK